MQSWSFIHEFIKLSASAWSFDHKFIIILCQSIAGYGHIQLSFERGVLEYNSANGWVIVLKLQHTHAHGGGNSKAEQRTCRRRGVTKVCQREG